MIELIAAAGAGAVTLEAWRTRRRGHRLANSNADQLAGSSVTIGRIPMVSSMGIERWSTYRSIYRSNPWIWASVNKLSSDLARYPLHVYERLDNGRRRRVRGDVPTSIPGRPTGPEALDRLLARPVGMSRYARNKGTWTDRLVYGNALWEIERDSAGPPTALTRRRWRNVVWVDEGEDELPRFYELRHGGRTRRIPAADVIHFGLGTDPESPVGVSPIEACRATVALHDAVTRHLLGYFANQARPSGHFKVDKVLTEQDYARVRQMILDAYTSPEAAGKVLVTSAEWQETSHTPDHSKVVELIKLSQEEAATVYGVPPPTIGILDRAIKSNVKELREQYIREGIGPWAAELEDDLESQLLSQSPSWRHLFLEMQLAEALRPDLEARALVYQRLGMYLSIDEIRELENREPLDLVGVSDVPWAASGARPITTAALEAKNKRSSTSNGHSTTPDPEYVTLEVP